MEEPRKKIVLVDDDPSNLAMGKAILAPHYDTYGVPSGEKLFGILTKLHPDLILLDIAMPKMDGYEVIRRLKSGVDTFNIPVIFLTALDDDIKEVEGLSLGAVDYIAKPFSTPLLLKRIELHLLVETQRARLLEYTENLEEMVRRKTGEVLNLQRSLLKTIANLVENRDADTGGHVERTRDYLEILLDTLIGDPKYHDEISKWDQEFFLQSSALHDVGKISIRDNILLKQGKLTPEEFAEMKKHTIYGVRIIEQIEKTAPDVAFLKMAKILAGTHHEKWDGSGYPSGLKGEGIPLGGRLMAIVDVYDALVSVRPYKTPFSHEDAIAIMQRGRGTQFDPALFDRFMKAAARFAEAADGLMSRQKG